MDVVKGPIAGSFPSHLDSGLEESHRIEYLIQTLAGEFDLVMGSTERVEALCVRLTQELGGCCGAAKHEYLIRLLPLLRKQSGARVAPVYAILEAGAVTAEDPWPLLQGMLAARDRGLVIRALDLAVSRIASGSARVSRPLLLFLAEQVETEESVLAGPTSLEKIALVLKGSGGDRSQPCPVTDLYLNEADGRLRRLAARVLDQEGGLPPSDLAIKLLGHDAYDFLRPYLDYTRATHLDLLRVAPPHGMPPVLPALRKAEEVCGEALLRETIAELGWSRVNLGLEVRQYVGLAIGRSFPLLVQPFEVPIVECCEEVRRVFETFLFVAYGGEQEASRAGSDGGDSIARFRAYNLTHAALLAEILDLSPLTYEKVRRILARMDRIVEDFIALFAAHSDEIAILPEVYGDLRQRIVRELEKEGVQAQLSAELTRLVQMFEDPPSLGSVRTLHGLKRYLHQKGLRLGMRLVQAGGSTNRTVDLAVASHKRILRTMKTLHYVDFEPEGEGNASAASYPVAALADALGRQMLHGQETFPSIKVFCYGNEVHYYLSFRNHPALLRIDYSPPLQGGMIDLEYYGVSKYELSLHPNPSLDALCLFFRRLEFDVQVESTHIHARYDKERALDLEDLCRKAEALFALIPYLMEVDWVIGGLNLGIEARRKVAKKWAERFALWHVLPLGQLLTRDRQAILTGVESGPTGEHELCWSGEGSYEDRFAEALPADFAERLLSGVDGLGLDLLSAGGEKNGQALGQIGLEQRFLNPIREAVARGELSADERGLQRCSPLLFQREHEAERLAAVLESSDETLVSAGNLAGLITPFERFLRFQTTGNIDGYEVQRARLPLRGERLGLYVLRDQAGIIRLALFTRGEGLWRRRGSPESPWESNSSCDAISLACLLRRANWPAMIAAASAPRGEANARDIRQHFRRPIEARLSAPEAGERVLTGLKASPGRAVGTALFGTAGRSPKDFDGAVLIAPVVRPEDNTFLYHAAGIVSTGGGVLSHAGLIAMQFHKPALIISGQWLQLADGSSSLLYRTLEFREERLAAHGRQITVRRRMRDKEYELREGDLVVLDAIEGTLRVLGQDRVTVALHEGFQLLCDTTRRLARASDPSGILTLRGRRLRARHQIEKVLAKLSDTVLVRHAVHEILVGGVVGEIDSGRGERARLLSLILENRSIAGAARNYMLQLADGMARSYRLLCEKALERIPSSNSLFEILALRLDILRLRQSLQDTAGALRECGFDSVVQAGAEAVDLESEVRNCIRVLRAGKIRAIESLSASPSGGFRSRELLRQVERLDAVVKAGTGVARPFCPTPRLVGSRASTRVVLTSGECCLELFELTGWKAANLAEAERIVGPESVPPWFVISDNAFASLLEEPLDKSALGREGVPAGAANLREAIDAIVARRDVDNAQKAAQIRALWKKTDLSEELAGEIVSAYRGLAGETPGAVEAAGQPFVAIRSSAREEDAELAARAGEFETFLFIRGEKALLDHVKLAWSGLWTERALHNRAILGTRLGRAGGGILVQRIVWSRVSGVLQTVNVAEGEMREMVINAGLGLGEGIVSGVVAADQVVVDKESDLNAGPLRFRYVTADKRERVVFNRRLGMGTMREETLYHQRLRPALEYVELAELVRSASALEEAYGLPLDIEFGIEGTRLWILQVRPVAAVVAALSETLEHYPLRE